MLGFPLTRRDALTVGVGSSPPSTAAAAQVGVPGRVQAGPSASDGGERRVSPVTHISCSCAEALERKLTEPPRPRSRPGITTWQPRCCGNPHMQHYVNGCHLLTDFCFVWFCFVGIFSRLPGRLGRVGSGRVGLKPAGISGTFFGSA